MIGVQKSSFARHDIDMPGVKTETEKAQTGLSKLMACRARVAIG